MASITRITRYTPEQYLAMERKADVKSEYDSGFISAMAGASIAHIVDRPRDSAARDQ